MTERVLGPTGSPRRRWTLLLPLIAAIALALFYVAGAKAVHDEDFQLDGNIAASPTGSVGGGTQNFDWESFFNASGQRSPVLPHASRPGFVASGFQKDFLTKQNGSFDTSDSSTYTEGSKDIDNISSWVCTGANNVTDKGDIMNAYAVAYKDPGTGDDILYFALERSANTGDANVAFWFLQSANANCTSGNWTGDHVDGDILVVSAFTKGGVVSTINAYRWNGGAGGSLGTTPVASGGDCTATTPPAPLGDNTCATANKATVSGIPWLTNNKQDDVGHALRTAELFEGGINLTDTGLAGRCFNTFVADTRSSQSLTATLYDFARGSIGECTSTTVTTPTPSGSAIIPANATVSASDSALVTVNGVASFSGTVSFFICGPNATQTLCASGGVAAGVRNITANGSVTSDTMTVTKVGHYCWRAVFSGDSSKGVPGSDDSRSSECFELTPRQPTLSTTAVNASGTPITTAQTLGTTIYDTALLGNTANKPGTGGAGDGSINPGTPGGGAGGTITFKLYGPDADGVIADQAACTALPLAAGFPAAGIVVNVSGNGTYGGFNATPPPPSVGFAPQSPGFYFWKAEYSGDSPNTLGVSHNGNCQASAERVEILQLQPTILTAQNFVPNDSATITVVSGGGDLAGKVFFKLWVDDATCSGAPDYATPAPGIDISSGTGTGLSRTVVSANTTSYAANGTTFHWVVEYQNSNPAHKNVTSACGIEHSSIVIDNDGP